jgi:hypothetical protein
VAPVEYQIREAVKKALKKTAEIEEERADSIEFAFKLLKIEGPGRPKICHGPKKIPKSPAPIWWAGREE